MQVTVPHIQFEAKQQQSTWTDILFVTYVILKLKREMRVFELKAT
jgi:hypothetical protein